MYCLNTRSCSCYYLAACCKKSNSSWSEWKKWTKKSALWSTSPRQELCKTESRHFFPLLQLDFFSMHLHTYGPNRVLELASPFYLKNSSENAKFFVASPSPAKVTPRVSVPLHPPPAPCPPPRLLLGSIGTDASSQSHLSWPTQVRQSLSHPCS